jgi:3-isopropylmalate dehydrogenase
MMLRHSLDLHEEAALIEKAINQVIAAGARTADIATGDDKILSTTEMTDAIIAQLR